ncbi:MAG: preprotein translocase subunit TatB, partial [Methylophilaceae bacterium]
MEDILQKYLHSAPQQEQNLQSINPVELLAELVARIRPPKPHQADYATNAVQALCHLLNRNPAYPPMLRDAILRLLGERKPVSFYVDSGIQPNSGFFSEMRRRISHKLLPDAINPAYLKDVFSLIFTRPSDEIWVHAVPDSVWLELLQQLNFDEAPKVLLSRCQQSLLDAAQVLSYRLSASGLQPELIRNHPELEDHASPFITQNVEFGDFLAATDESAPGFKHIDISHILVMLDQCRLIIAKIRRNSSQTGTSLDLTFLLQGMTQQIRRLEALLTIIKRLRAGENTHQEFVSLFKTLVSAESHKND